MTNDTTPTKMCKKCGETFPATLDHFHRQKRGKYGLRSQCKECIAERSRQYREANRGKIAERDRQYREANREKVSEYQRQYREANSEKVSEKARCHREANREKIAERQRQYREDNPDYARQYYEANQ